MRRPAASAHLQAVLICGFMGLAWAAQGQTMAAPSSLPGWDNEAPAKAWDALMVSCAAWAGMPPDRPLMTAPPSPASGAADADPGDPPPTARAATPAAWRGLCEAAATLARQMPPPEAPRRGSTPAAIAQREAVAAAVQAREQAFRALLDEHLVAMPLGTGILTGYYEPMLRGARQPDLRHRTPLYARPPSAAEEPPPAVPVAEAPPNLLRRATAASPGEPPWAGVPRPPWPDPARLPRAGALAGPAHAPAAPGMRVPVPADPVAKPEAGEAASAEPLDAAAEPPLPDLMSGHGLPTTRAGSRQPSLPSRGAIDAGALAGRGLELVYVDNAADAFFLHIQGSGRVVLADGKVLRLGYAAQNGHPYVPIGRILTQRGVIPRERMSMQAIRAWLSEAPPAEAAALMAENPSYIFFRVMEGLRPDEGPPGSLGVPLIPGRSLAVDRAHVPLGAPVFLVGRDPVTGAAFHRLTMAQDTGGAIRGRARGDLFFGWGDAAGEAAGRARDDAQFWVLIPRPAPEPAATETATAP